VEYRGAAGDLMNIDLPQQSEMLLLAMRAVDPRSAVH